MKISDPDFTRDRVTQPLRLHPVNFKNWTQVRVGRLTFHKWVLRPCRSNEYWRCFWACSSELQNTNDLNSFKKTGLGVWGESISSEHIPHIHPYITYTRALHLPPLYPTLRRWGISSRPRNIYSSLRSHLWWTRTRWSAHVPRPF